MNESLQIGDGEHRALVYKELGLKEIPAFIIPRLNDDIQRRLHRQTMNKLKGEHEIKMDADEIALIFQNDKLDNLAELIAQERESLELIIGRRQELFDNQVKEITELNTEHKCPQCGYEW